MYKDGSVSIRLLTLDDVSIEYLSWLRDPEVCQYLESRWSVYTMEDLTNYVKSVNDGNNFLFGVFLDNKHIGNIKIGNVNWIHRFADVGIMIGDKSIWGRGYGTKAIELATEYAFNELNLHHLIAGIYANNIASYKAFLKAGYREIGRFTKRRFFRGIYVDEILMERVNDKI